MKFLLDLDFHREDDKITLHFPGNQNVVLTLDQWTAINPVVQEVATPKVTITRPGVVAENVAHPEVKIERI